MQPLNATLNVTI